jgi:homoserine O-acetyltransferase
LRFESSRFYNPARILQNKAPLLAVNSADDQVNPPELGLMEKNIQLVKKRNIYPVAHQI